MPFAQFWPPSPVTIGSAKMREQFTGLKTLIDNVPAGSDGAPGDVNTQQMNDAIASTIGGTSNNTNAVELLASDADLPTVIAKINEMLTAQRR